MISVGWMTLYALIPAFAALVGGGIGTCVRPKGKVVSALQHFVAGVIIAAVATELLPKVAAHTSHLTVSIGFVVGVLFMLGVEEGVHALAKKRGGGLLAAAAVDLFVDGLLIAFAFLAGEHSGVLIAFSLSLCAFFLNLTIASSLKKRRFGTTILLASMLPFGTFLGGAVVSHLPHLILLEAISFGVAALLYLGIEELLRRAHKEEETVWITATFFLGFFLIFVLP